MSKQIGFRPFVATQVIHLGVDPAGPAALASTSRAVVEQLEKRIRETKDAITLISDYREMYRSEADKHAEEMKVEKDPALQRAKRHHMRTATMRAQECGERLKAKRAELERLTGQLKLARRAR